jgi:hypothetical protein
MIETARRAPLAARARRLRNRCLASLAAGRALPVPGERDVAQLGDELGLGELWREWETMHTPAASSSAIRLRPVARWRSPQVEKPVLLALVAILGFVVGDRWLLPAQAEPVVASVRVPWAPVTDSVAASLNGKLLSLGQTELAVPVVLSPAEAALLVFRRQLGVDSVEARIDTTLRVRGRLRDGKRFELAGDLRVARPGIGELRVGRLRLGTADASTASLSRSIVGHRAIGNDSASISFPIPSFIARLGVADSTALVSRRR